MPMWTKRKDGESQEPAGPQRAAKATARSWRRRQSGREWRRSTASLDGLRSQKKPCETARQRHRPADRHRDTGQQQPSPSSNEICYNLRCGCLRTQRDFNAVSSSPLARRQSLRELQSSLPSRSPPFARSRSRIPICLLLFLVSVEVLTSGDLTTSKQPSK